MAEKEPLTPEKHREQIAAYSAVRPDYVLYADALRRVLEQACQVSFPEALVQARAKTVSSFAEKVVRRYERYVDPVHEMTDLCGARVIVQTTEQVKAVRRFIEANFAIDKRDDKGLLLSETSLAIVKFTTSCGMRPDQPVCNLPPQSSPRSAISAQKFRFGLGCNMPGRIRFTTGFTRTN